MTCLRVVIADDEALTRMDIREMLEEAGHQVIGEVGNGLEAIKLTQTLRPDLVMLDIKMPGLDGIEATKAITDMGYPVLLLTAYSQSQIIERAKKVGALNFLVKPVAERDVLPAVEMAYSLHHRLQMLRNEVETVRNTLAERKIIEKACSVYADHFGLTYEQAYQRMGRKAMNKNLTLFKVARELLVDLSRKEKSSV